MTALVVLAILLIVLGARLATGFFLDLARAIVLLATAFALTALLVAALVATALAL